jgi:L-ascorbate metabolism protein UlaG (beta-lactamase superfamily)
MQFTKYSHSCVRLDDAGRALVIDPGVFSEAATALAGANAVLITHEHPDHLDAAALRAAAASNPELRIWAPAGVAASLADRGDQVSVAAGEESFEVAGFQVRTVGHQHAVVHPLIPVIANVGYLIDGALYHPGDSLTVPSVAVQTLLAPISAPWLKASEVIDFIISVRAPRVLQLHDAIVNEVGTNLVEGLIKGLTAPFGVEFTHLAPTATLTL